MIADLIKLSKELYELDMVSESMEIDEMIEKLYGIGRSEVTPEPEEIFDDLQDTEGHLREIFRLNAGKEVFVEELVSIIKEYYEPEEILKVIDLLTE